jgi:uncharacterized protein YegL
MGVGDNVKGLARRQMALFFLIDTSGSMAGDGKITAVNTAMREVAAELKKLDDPTKNADSDIEIAVLEFNSDAEWLTPPNKPVPVKEYVWRDLTADGSTNLGEAYRKLDEALGRGKVLRDHNLYAPALILMSDGAPDNGYQQGFEVLKKNSFFANMDSKGKYKEKSIRVACAIGADANKSVLAEFTGNPELVFEAHSISQLKNWIKFIAVATTLDDEKGVEAALAKFEAEQKVEVASAEEF